MLTRRWLIASLLTLLLPAVACAEDSASTFVEGEHYVRLDNEVRTVNPNKIEVTEVFWYGCSHCFHLSCVSKCVVAGCLSCPLCRTQTFSAPRARAIEAASEGDAAAAAIAAAAGRHRARLEQRLEQRRVDRRTFRRRHGV